MSSLPKPELRGHLRRYIIKTVAGATIFAAINCCLFHFFYEEPRKKAYAEYARSYNVDEHFKLLKKYGYLSSAK